MPDPVLTSVVIRFDIFEIDLRAGELRKRGRRVKLQEQPFRVLSSLLQRSGEMVTRDELRQSLWPADTFVDFDHGLNSAVARLREALCDSADKPRFIETVAKRGYRFIAPVDDASPAVSASIEVTTVSDKTKIRSHVWTRIWIASVLIVACLCAIGLWAFHWKSAESPLPSIEVVPLVGLRGFQVTPAFSPDGNLVAFRQSDGAHNTNLHGGRRRREVAPTHQRFWRLLPHLVP